MKRILTIFLLLICLPAFSKHVYKEKEYQEAWCTAREGVMEYKLPDKTRVDCLLPDYAVEFDFGAKWAESIGQSLYYGMMTERTPAVVLILENPEKELKYLNRLQIVAEQYGIKVFTMTLEDYELTKSYQDFILK